MFESLLGPKFTVNEAAWTVVVSFGYLVFVILLGYFRGRFSWIWIGIATGVFLMAVGCFLRLRARYDRQSIKATPEALEPHED